MVTLLFAPLNAKLKFGEFRKVTPVMRTLDALVNCTRRGRVVMVPALNAAHQAAPLPSIVPLPVIAMLVEPEAQVMKCVLGFG